MQIYQYTNAAEFLYDAWSAKKEKNPAFSLRAWARKLGLSSNAPLTLMFQGKRPIPKRYLPILAKDLGLTSKETIYLETLLKLNRSKDEETTAYYQNILTELKPNKDTEYIQLEHRRLIEDPLHFILLDIFALKGAKADPNWIQGRLTFNVGLTRIKQCIMRLEELGLIQIHADDVRRFEGMYQTKVDVSDKSIQEVHQKAALLANQMIERLPVKEREYNVSFITLNRKQVEEVRLKIRDFIQALLKQYDNNDQADCTYQLSSQLFKLFDLGGMNALN